MRSNLRYVSWTMYLVGTALVFGSYVGAVPLGLAWVGWGVGMVGWVLTSFVRRRPPD